MINERKIKIKVNERYDTKLAMIKTILNNTEGMDTETFCELCMMLDRMKRCVVDLEISNLKYK